ncbi:MAG: RNA polymerase factor sigma-54, partial [Bdellovibrionales bacterium]|nr:RNA polymerase factor sigma-54 [Bdellovibrionales bacterium]
MALEAKLVQKLSQSLLMTPQLQQAIKLLQLGRLEYIEAIQQELLENPVLEELREDDSDSRPAPDQEVSPRSDESPSSEKQESESAGLSQDTNDSPVDWESYLENFTDYSGASSPKGIVDHSERPSLEATLTKEQTLREYLVSQLRMSDVEEGDYIIAITVLGNLDRNGYLCCEYEEIAEQTGKSLEDVDRVVSLMRELDPPGVCARNLGECLLFQLDLMGKADGLEARIVSRHLDKLEKRKYEAIAKEEDVAVEKVYEAVKAIQSLEPRPGRPFADEDTRYITPDIYVYKDGGEYIISLNEDGMPKLRVSPYYLDVLKNSDDANGENRAYLNERLKSASWLIKSIHQRQQTIYKVTESIVKYQRDFLDHGIEKLRPLVLKDVADDIGMHESTVSRVTTNKYVHTPQGVFELKFFFSTAIKTADGDVSSSSIKEKIKHFIAEEDPKKPISDQRIV